MNAADWIAVASAVGTVAAAALAAFAFFSSRKDARKSAEAAGKSLDETKRQVDISRQIADLADQTFGSSCRPIIVSAAIPYLPFEYPREAADEHNSWSRNDRAAYIKYPMRNIGVGPAMIVSVKMIIIIRQYDGTKTKTTYDDARLNIAAVAPNEIGHMELLVPVNKGGSLLIESLERRETLTAEISYTDIGAKRRYLTRFELDPRQHRALKAFSSGPAKDFSDFSLAAIQVYECDEQGNTKGLPIASNKPPDPDGSPQD